MQNWQRVRVAADTPLLDIFRVINEQALGFVLVCEGDVLVGAITDGDIRRALVRRHDLGLVGRDIMNPRPISLPASVSRKERASFQQRFKLSFLPIVDEVGRVTEVLLSEALPGNRDDATTVVLMAGGLGSRMGDLTRTVPKPLLEVNGEPIIETIIKRFRDEGFGRFIAAVNYLADVVIDRLGDGRRLGVEIEYVREPKRLGTAGALSLIDAATLKPPRLIVTNCDVLCATSYRLMLQFHVEHGSLATMAVKQHRIDIPFGIVEVDGFEIRSQREKPVYNYLINAGFYVLNAEALALVPKDTFFDMPDLFAAVRAGGGSTVVYPTSDQWIDIGRPEDLERARGGDTAAAVPVVATKP